MSGPSAAAQPLPSSATDRPRINRAPVSTYRLQLRSDFGLEQVRQLQPYLARLGVSDLYLSPLFEAREESSHGYDVVDHGVIDPAFGDLAAFKRLAEQTRQSGMGILLDVVPNHMGINDRNNRWWNDVLENGEASWHAGYFDIEWRPPARHLQHKVLLPFLGEPFGKVLEKAELRVVYENGRLQLNYHGRYFPLAPASWPVVLDVARDYLAQAHDDAAANSPAAIEDLIELESIVTQLDHLPPPERLDQEAMRERYREQRVAQQRLLTLTERSAAARRALEDALAKINGVEGDPRSFDLLEQLLDRQRYRLAYWRVASDEINYRRFFDINDLAAIRVEDPQVFDAVHRLVAEFLSHDWVSGLRIDHPDGLYDPQAYFDNLHALYRRSRPAGDGDAASEIYIVAEKILSGDEQLCTDWKIQGTTGYDLLNLLNRLLIDGEGLSQLRASYERLTGVDDPPAEVLYQSKRAVLLASMASELHMLAAWLHRIAQQHRAARDFTLPVLERALRETIASMSVYRIYVRPQGWDVSENDYRRVSTAVRMAKRRNRTMPTPVFDFISSVLLLEHPPGLADEQAAERRRFVLKMQQVTGPVTAKGLEDTAFYRYYPLASLNEVGGELDAAPLAAEEFHRLMGHRAATWPLSLSATGTHDTKRGEDMRARLHVLSEIADQWIDAVERWYDLNLGAPEGEPDDAIDPSAEYLLYQTLVGTWPLSPMDDAARDQYVDRILAYMQKALREAKVNTSWMNPAPAYEDAVAAFIRRILDPTTSREFLAQLDALVRQIATAGYANGLAQTLLKTTLPGVPDFYQGSELWDFNLVDPDNRRPVDFERRAKLLADLERRHREDAAGLAAELAGLWPDPQIKLLVIWRTLQLRRRLPDVFSTGEYIPLAVTGCHNDHLLAFARRAATSWTISVVPMQVKELEARGVNSARIALPKFDWSDATIVLPPEAPRSWRHEFTGQTIECDKASADEPALSVARLLVPIPVALLSSL